MEDTNTTDLTHSGHVNIKRYSIKRQTTLKHMKNTITPTDYTHYLCGRTFRHDGTGTVYTLNRISGTEIHITWPDIQGTMYQLTAATDYIYGTPTEPPCWVICEPDTSGAMHSVAPPPIPGVTDFGTLARPTNYAGAGAVATAVPVVDAGPMVVSGGVDSRTAPVGGTRTITRKTLHQLVRVAVIHGSTYGAVLISTDDINAIINSVLTNTEYGE
jgi:hypothetical protein